MIRLLHIADVHFDTGFACKSDEIREALRVAVRDAFSLVVDDAVRLRVDALLIAGDLLDDEHLRLDTERFLFEQVSRLGAEGIPVVYVTGNHDPGSPKARIRELRWPDNVTFIGDRNPTVVELQTRGGKLRVVGAGHDMSRLGENLAATFPRFDDQIPTVGLLHANVDSCTSDDHGRYAPCSIADLESRRYDYWALGHIHAPGPVRGSQAIWYAGCLQGRHFREDGLRGACLVSMGSLSPSGTQTTVELKSYAPIRWEKVVVDNVGRFRGASQLDDAVAREVEAVVRRASGVRLAVRVTLRGETELWRSLTDADERGELEDQWREKLNLLYVEVDASQTYRPLNIAALRDEPTVLSEALSLIDEIAAGGTPAKALLREVLQVGARATEVDGLDLVGEPEILRRSLAERFSGGN